jgi:hypothetical protein
MRVHECPVAVTDPCQGQQALTWMTSDVVLIQQYAGPVLSEENFEMLGQSVVKVVKNASDNFRLRVARRVGDRSFVLASRNDLSPVVRERSLRT